MKIEKLELEIIKRLRELKLKLLNKDFEKETRSDINKKIKKYEQTLEIIMEISNEEKLSTRDGGIKGRENNK